MANFRILQNVIFDGVAYEKGNILDLGFVNEETVKSLVDREVIAETQDGATVVHGEGNAVGSNTVPAQTEESAAAGGQESTTQAPLEEQNQQEQPAPSAQTQTAPAPTQEQLEQDFASAGAVKQQDQPNNSVQLS